MRYKSAFAYVKKGYPRLAAWLESSIGASEVQFPDRTNVNDDLAMSTANEHNSLVQGGILVWIASGRPLGTDGWLTTKDAIKKHFIGDDRRAAARVPEVEQRAGAVAAAAKASARCCRRDKPTPCSPVDTCPERRRTPSQECRRAASQERRRATSQERRPAAGDDTDADLAADASGDDCRAGRAAALGTRSDAWDRLAECRRTSFHWRRRRRPRAFPSVWRIRDRAR